MANRIYDRDRYDREYDEEERYGRGSDDWRYSQGYPGAEAYYRNYGSSYNDPNRSYSGSRNEPYRSYGGSYNEPYRGYGGSYNEPSRGYGGSDYGRYESGSRSGEPYGRGDQERHNDPFYRNRVYRGFNRGWEEQGGQERGFLERAGDEVRSWFGDEEAERRRRQDEVRSQHAGRGPKGYRRSDERIREDVNERLTGDYYLDAHDVDVSVSDGVVTLTGRVDSRRDKRRAEDLAESVSGVKDVTNQLRVEQGTTETTTGADVIGTTRTRTAKP